MQFRGLLCHPFGLYQTCRECQLRIVPMNREQYVIRTVCDMAFRSHNESFFAPSLSLPPSESLFFFYHTRPQLLQWLVESCSVNAFIFLYRHPYDTCCDDPCIEICIPVRRLENYRGNTCCCYSFNAMSIFVAVDVQVFTSFTVKLYF